MAGCTLTVYSLGVNDRKFRINSRELQFASTYVLDVIGVIERVVEGGCDV